MKSEDFIEASGYIRVLEKKMLTTASIERIIDSKDVSDALKIISQNSEFDFLSLIRTADYEEVLLREDKRIYELVYTLAKENTIVADIFYIKYSFYNIKVAIKAHLLNKNVDYLFSDLSSISIKNLKEFVSLVMTSDATNLTSVELPDFVCETIYKVKADYIFSNDIQSIDISIDKAMFEYINLLSAKANNDFISEYVQMQIDSYNVKTFLRIKEMNRGKKFLENTLINSGAVEIDFYISHYDETISNLSNIFYYKYYGETVKSGLDDYSDKNNFSKLEKLFDNYMITHVKKSKMVAFGAEILFSYALSKENELKQVRIILACIQNNISKEDLKGRLRENYA